MEVSALKKHGRLGGWRGMRCYSRQDGWGGPPNEGSQRGEHKGPVHPGQHSWEEP